MPVVSVSVNECLYAYVYSDQSKVDASGQIDRSGVWEGGGERYGCGNTYGHCSLAKEDLQTEAKKTF